MDVKTSDLTGSSENRSSPRICLRRSCRLYMGTRLSASSSSSIKRSVSGASPTSIPTPGLRSKLKSLSDIHFSIAGTSRRMVLVDTPSFSEITATVIGLPSILVRIRMIDFCRVVSVALFDIVSS